MGLPKILFDFIKRAQTAIKRSGRGVVALILADDTAETLSYKYSLEDDVKIADWTSKNLEYLKLVFKAKPKCVLVERVPATDTTYDDALARLSIKKWNYLAVPGLDKLTGKVAEIKDYIIKKRAAGKGFKAVLPNCEANNEGIINFTTEDIVSDETEYTTAEYCARIAGFLATIPLDRSCTYMVLDDVTSITESLTPDDDVDNGQLIIINDDGFKIGAEVNSLVTLSGEKTKDMKSIKVVEGMDLMREDICTSFKNGFINHINGYDDKITFVNACVRYGAELQKQGVLNREYAQSFSLDVEATEAYLIEQGVDTSEMSESEILRADTGKEVFILADIKFLKAAENLTFRVIM